MTSRLNNNLQKSTERVAAQVIESEPKKNRNINLKLFKDLVKSGIVPLTVFSILPRVSCAGKFFWYNNSYRYSRRYSWRSWHVFNWWSISFCLIVAGFNWENLRRLRNQDCWNGYLCWGKITYFRFRPCWWVNDIRIRVSWWGSSSWRSAWGAQTINTLGWPRWWRIAKNPNRNCRGIRTNKARFRYVNPWRRIWVCIPSSTAQACSVFLQN